MCYRLESTPFLLTSQRFDLSISRSPKTIRHQILHYALSAPRNNVVCFRPLLYPLSLSTTQFSLEALPVSTFQDTGGKSFPPFNMNISCGFLAPSLSSNLKIRLQSAQMPRRSAQNLLSPLRTTMTQAPDQKEKPTLGSMYEHGTKNEKNFGKPIKFGTGRALQENHDNDPAKTCVASLSAAEQSLEREAIQLVHCTVSLGVDVGIVSQTLRKELNVPVLGRTISKKESSGAIETLVLSSEEGKGISFGSSTFESLYGAEDALMNAASFAAEEALDGQLSKDSCAYMIFCHTPGDTNIVRTSLEKSVPNVIAYGGPAFGYSCGKDWKLFGDNSIQSKDSQSTATVHVAAIPGSLHFLCSSLIKSWVEPVYSESLPFLELSYTGNPDEDLLTAIRYNDWEKFVWCIEHGDVDVNTKWAKKQHQSPLIAACARARVQMVKYLLDRSADVKHRNDGGYTAMMYTRKLTEFDRDAVLRQLKMLADAGANMQLTDQERAALLKVSSGGIVE